MLITDEYEVDGDAEGAGESECVGAEEDEVADDAEVGGAFQEDGHQHGRRGGAGPQPATQRRRAAGRRWSGAVGQAGPRARTTSVLRHLPDQRCSECSLSGRGQGHVSNFYIVDLENFATASHRYTGDIHKSTVVGLFMTPTAEV